MKPVISNILIFLISLSLAISIPFYFQDLLVFSVMKLGLGWVMTTILLRFFVILFFIFALNALLLLIKRGKRTRFVIVLAIGIVPGFFLSFAIEPIYDIDYFMLGDELVIENEKFVELEAATDSSYQRRNRYEVLAFLDVGCDHCQKACEKFGINKSAGQKVPIELFFANDSANVTHFLETYNGKDLSHHYLDSEKSFVKFAGYEFPSIFLIDPNEKTEYHWIGERMNYTALDYLLRLEQ